jgi:paraquat-inducible protein B
MHGPSGKSVILHTAELGSVNLGAPVYFRRFEVGQVVDRQLEADGRSVRVVAFIDAPNDRFLTKSTRFWNASGIDLTLGADGMKLKTESLASVLVGGIAFETAPGGQNSQPAPSGTHFTLFKDETTAMAPPDGEPHYVRMRFGQSLRGLSIGAPVEFVGVSIGRVLSIDLDYDATDHTFPVIVTALIYPRRMGRAYETLVEQGTAESDEKMAKLVGQLVARGLRAQPRTGNLLTGQLYLALDFVPSAGKAQFSPDARPLEIPTVPGSIDELQPRLANIVTKIDRMPLNDIAQHFDNDLKSLHGTLEQVDTQVLPAAKSTLGAAQHVFVGADRTLAEDAPWRENLDQTLAEARRTLRSVRSLTDFLNRHPEALIRGRQREMSPQDARTTPAGATP